MPGGSLQFLIIVLILSFSFLSWVYRQLQEQKAKRAARDARVRREEEMLRTGRNPGAEAAREMAERPEPARSLEERQAELRDQRREQPVIPTSAPASAPAPAPAPASPSRQVPPGMREVELWPGGPRVLIPAGSAAPGTPARPAPQPAPRAPSTPRPPKVRKASSASARAAGGSSRANAAAAQEEGKQSASRDAVRRAQAASALESRAADAGSGSGEAPRGVAVSLPRTPQEWRSALVLNEILSRPVAERDPTGEF